MRTDYILEYILKNSINKRIFTLKDHKVWKDIQDSEQK